MRVRLCAFFVLILGLGPSTVLPAETAHLLVDANRGGPDPNLPGVAYVPPTQFAKLGDRAVFFVTSFDGASRPQLTLWTSDGAAAGTELLATFCTDGEAGCRGPGRLLGRADAVVLLDIPKVGESFRHELWRTDGTAAGTGRLHPNVCSSSTELFESTEVIAGGELFFAAFDETAGCELWVSDGTTGGTRRVADLRPGRNSSEPTSFAVLGDRVYFKTISGGLWTTDGTSGGTAFVRGFPFLRLVTAARGRLFFQVPEGDGVSLWTSDGTATGSRRVRFFPVYIPCYRCDPLAQFLRPDRDGVLFVADDGRHGRQLWRSDGTASGTRRLTGLPDRTLLGLNGVVLPETFTALRSSLLFPATRTTDQARLWVSRRTVASTVRLEGCPGGCPIVRSSLQPVAGGRRAVFAGRGRQSLGVELWVSDGTAAGTHLVRDLCPGPCSSSPSDFVAVGGLVYFNAADASGAALWRTDGTAEGTILLGRASLPYQAGGAALSDRVLLGVTSGERTSDLWATDGTQAGTRRLRTFARAAGSSHPRFARLDDRVVFVAQENLDSALWVSDGLTSRRLISGSQLCGQRCDPLSPPVAAGGLAFVLAGIDTEAGVLGARLVRTDGTPEGTAVVHDFGLSSFVRQPFLLGDRLGLLRCDTQAVGPTILHRCDFWSSDGTPEGTAPLVELAPAAEVTPPVVVGADFYFFLFAGKADLYRSDGTPAGTYPIQSFFSFGLGPLEIAGAGGQLFFAIDGALRRSDGTAEGTDFFFGNEVSGLTEFEGQLLFFGTSTEDPPRRGLWSTDGTAGGTFFLAPAHGQPPNLVPGLYGPPQWTRLGSRLLFRAWDPDHGHELWVTDGTVEGTGRLMDIAPGKGSSFPEFLALGGGEVWFAANDGVHGSELWLSDGTATGTRLGADLVPGPFSSSPRELTPAGENLFFSAESLVHGREPWVLRLP